MGCTHPHYSKELIKLYQLMDTDPNATLDSLNLINKSTLNKADRYFYDFLTIKSERKICSPIKSNTDSIILNTIDFFRNNNEEHYLADALYTAGLVYLDMGDNPTALEYFHKALEVLPPDKKNLKLRGIILSQTGRLLSTLRLNKEAIATLSEASLIFKATRDTIHCFNNLILLAATYQRASLYNQADSVLKEAILINSHDNKGLSGLSYMYTAIGNAKNGNFSLAKLNIRKSLDCIDDLSRNIALAHAARIYYSAGAYDSAYIFANQLIHSSSSDSKASGYDVILSPELRAYLPSDSLDSYYQTYALLLREYYDENSNDLSIREQSIYNYRLHQQKRIEAESKINKQRISIILLIVFACLFLFLAYRWKQKNTRHIIRLHQALDLVASLRQEINQNNWHSTTVNKIETNDTIPLNEDNTDNYNNADNKSNEREIKKLRKMLQEELKDLYKNKPTEYLDERIKKSKIYQTFNTALQNNKPIREDSPAWHRLESLILSIYPNFRVRLQLLTNYNLKDIDLHTVLLMKCGFKSIEMSIILGRAKSSINYRRSSLSKKFFDIELDTKTFDGIMRLM